MAWRVMGVLATLTVAAVVTGCSGDANPLGHTAEQSYEISEPVSTVTVDAEMASIDIRTGDGPVTVTEVLRFAKARPAVSHQVDGTTLRLTETGCGGVRLRCDIEYRIQVPARTAVQVTTKAGAVMVRGLAGSLAVTSDAGAINGQQLAVDRATVVTKAGAAKLQFAEPPARVVATTDLGAIEVRLPGDRSYAVDVSTDLGASDVTVDRDAGSAYRISVKTKVGAVRIAPNQPS